MPKRIQQKRNHSILLLAASLALCLFVWGALQIRQTTLENLRRGLSQALGVPVELGNMHVWLPNRVIIQDVRIGDLVSIPQVELHLSVNGALKPRVDRLLLLRPKVKIRITPQMVANRKVPTSAEANARATAAPPKMARRSRRRSLGRWARHLDRLVIRDGSAEIEFPWAGQRLTVNSRGIYVHKPESQGGVGDLRIVAAISTITSDAGHRLDSTAAAVDLEFGSGMPRLLRLASLDNRIRSRYLNSDIAAPSILLDHQLDTFAGRIRLSQAGVAGGLDLTFGLDPNLQPAKAQFEAKNFSVRPFANLLRLVGITGNEARLSGKAQAQSRSGKILINADLKGEALGLSAPALAHYEIGPFTISARTRLTLQPNIGLLDVHRLALTTGGLVANVSGRAQLGQGGPRISMKLEVPEVDCQGALRALPTGLAPMLEGMALRGTIGLSAALDLDDYALDDTRISVELTPNSCQVLADPPLADVNKLARAFTVNARGPRGTPLPWHLGSDNPYWRSLRRISRHLQAAIIAAEDNRFFRHRGFDTKQLKRAFVMNVAARKIVRGASTISQQLIKNVFLSHRRTLSRKLQETILTWRMEQVIDKPRILELYLNLIEMGPGLFGVEQGAQHYFGTSASKLSPLQAAHIASITPSPRPLARRFRTTAPDAAWRDKLQLILRLMRRAGKLTRNEVGQWGAAQLKLAARLDAEE